jgi:hypothetical protein
MRSISRNEELKFSVLCRKRIEGRAHQGANLSFYLAVWSTLGKWQLKRLTRIVCYVFTLFGSRVIFCWDHAWTWMKQLSACLKRSFLLIFRLSSCCPDALIYYFRVHLSVYILKLPFRVSTSPLPLFTTIQTWGNIFISSPILVIFFLVYLLILYFKVVQTYHFYASLNF